MVAVMCDKMSGMAITGREILSGRASRRRDRAKAHSGCIPNVTLYSFFL
jgi:hypothetical protein